MPPDRRHPSPRSFLIAARCGLAPPDAAMRRRLARSCRRAADALARRIARSLRPGAVILLTGPSGAGKSSALTSLRRRLPHAVAVGNPPRRALPIAELPAAPLDRWLAALSAAGLAEARLWLRETACLSSGQRNRLALALAMARAERTAPGARTHLLIADDLGCGLDPPTRASVASALARWARRRRIALVAASVNDDLAPFLRPDRRFTLELDAPALECAA